MKSITLLTTQLLLIVSLTSQADNLTYIYDLALANDPQLRAANAAYLAGKESENIGKAALLPSISANAEYSETDSDQASSSVFVLNGQQITSAIRGDGDADQTSYAVSVNQPIFNLPLWYDYKSGKTLSDKARLEYAAAQQTLILRVSDAYFGVLRASDNLTSSIAEQEAIGRQLEQTRQRFDVGLLPITDVHEAQAAFDNAKVNTLILQGQLQIAFEALEVITGTSHTELAGLVENFPVLPPDASRQQWVDISLENNLQLKIAQDDKAIAQHNATARKMEHLPTVSAAYRYADADYTSKFAGVDQFDNQVNTPSSNDTQSHIVSVHLDVPIFTGGLVSAQRRQALQQFSQADELLSFTQRSTRQRARSAHLNVLTDAAAVKARRQAIVSAESALEATRAGYDVGTRNIVDVLFAERNLHQARRNYANARYDYIASSLTLKEVAGQLSPDDIYQLNAWVDPQVVVVPGPTLANDSQ